MTRINLLPPEERTRAAREQGLLLAIVGLIALVAVLGGLYFLQFRQVSTKQTQINDVSAQVDAANVQIAALRPYATLQAQRTAMQLSATQIYSSRVIVSNILEEISLLIPQGMSIQTLSITVPPYMTSGANDLNSGASSSSYAADLSITGDSQQADLYQSQDQVATFLTQLGMMPQLMNVKLISSQQSPGVPTDCVFNITASLRPFAAAPPLAPAAPAITMGGGQ